MATRYKVIFRTSDYIADHGYKNIGYTVATELDERKAIVFAAWIYFSSHPNSQIFSVVSVEKLPGEIPKRTDIVDRMEY